MARPSLGGGVAVPRSGLGPGARLDKTSNLLQTAIGVIRIGGEFAGGPLYRYLGYQEASDLHANYREGTVADFNC